MSVKRKQVVQNLFALCFGVIFVICALFYYNVITKDAIISLLQLINIPIKSFQFTENEHAEFLETIYPNSVFSVEIENLENGIVNVGDSFKVSWSRQYRLILDSHDDCDFVVFSMPNTVRLKNGNFLTFPPQVNLPFGFQYAPDSLRVVFPINRLNNRIQNSFDIIPLVSGWFTLTWDFVIVTKSGKMYSKSSDKSPEEKLQLSFKVQDLKPQIKIQDSVKREKPLQTILSPSGEYKILEFKNRFQVLYARNEELILEKSGKLPRFSPGSRFIAFFYNERNFQVVDLLNQKIVPGIPNKQGIIAWGKNDSVLIIGFGSFGEINVIFPLIDNNNIIKSGIIGCHACNSWFSKFYIDMENSLVHFIDTSLGLCHYVKSHSMVTQNKDAIYEEVFDKKSLYPKHWDINGSFQITHIPDKLLKHIDANSSRNNSRHPEMSSFIKHPILLRTNIPNQMAKIGQKGSIIRGKPLFKRNILFSHDDSIYSNKYITMILKRLNDIGFNIYKNCSPSIQNSFKGKTTSAMKMISSLRSKHKVLRKLSYDKVVSKRFINRHKNDSSKWIKVDHKYWINNKHHLWAMKTDYGSLPGNSGYGASWGNDIVLFSSLDNKKTNTSLFKTLLEHNIRLFDGNHLFDTELGESKEFFTENNILLITYLNRTGFTNKSFIIVFDTLKNQLIALLNDIPEYHDIHSLYLSKNAKFVLQINSSGRFYFHNIQYKTVVLNGTYIDDELLLYTDSGIYDSTLEASHYVSWFYPGLKQHFNFSQFESEFKKPEIINHILSGKNIVNKPVKIIPPPSVEIKLKSKGNFDSKVIVDIKVKSILPLKNVRVFVDGSPILKLSTLKRSFIKTVSFDLLRGKHWITAVAYNSKGYSSIPQNICVDASHVINAAKGKLYVVGIGVDEYPLLPNSNLLYAKRDINSFIKVMKDNPSHQYGQVLVSKLLDAEVTSENIKQTMEQIAKQSASEDTVVLYFAGHGMKSDDEFFFLTSQSRIDCPWNNSILWEDISSLLKQIRAKVIVFIDACHSGVMQEKNFVPNEEYVEKLMNSGKVGMVVMASSKGRQLSYEYENLQHGVFNYAIIQSLGPQRDTVDKNRNGIIEFDELYLSVKYKVKKMTKGEQTPWISANKIIGRIPLL